MVSLLFALLSLLLYVFAPVDYSLAYNWIILSLFVINFVRIARGKSYKLLSYTTVFFVVFFFVNFAYPVFIYPYDPLFILQFRYSFSPEYINSGSALCLLAFSLYLCGYELRAKPYPNYNFIIRQRVYELFHAVTFCVLLYNLYLVIPQWGVNYGDASVPFQSASLFVMLECTLTTIICFTKKDALRGNVNAFFKVLRFHIVVSIIFCITFLILGSREYVLVLSLLYVLLFTLFVRPIGFIKLFVALIVALTFFYFVSERRNNADTDGSLFSRKAWQAESVSGAWNLATDLIINNRNVYVGMQYANDPAHGFTYGVNYIPNLLSPVPFLPSLFTYTFLGVPPVECTSQQILTNYTRDELGHRDLYYELGTNSVVDIYMGFGVCGVVIMFFLLGFFVKKLEVSLNDNAIAFSVYAILFTTVIFFCRSSFFGPFRNMIWAFLICCLMFRMYRKVV